MATKPAKLLDLTIDEVSAVDRGANPHAAIVLMKRRDPGKPATKWVQKSDGVMWNSEMSWSAYVDEICCALRQKFGSMGEPGESWLYVMNVYDTTVVFNQGGDMWRADYTASVANGEVIVTVGERVAVDLVYQDSPTPEGGAMDKSAETVDTATFEAIKKQADQNAAELVELRKAAAVTAAALEMQKAENERLAKAAEEATRAAHVEKDLRLLGEYKDVAKRRIPALSGSDDEKAKLIKSLHDNLPSEEAESVMKMLEAGNAAIASHFSPIGVSGAAGASDAYGKIQAMAKARASEKGISFSKAMAAVASENPDLYEQYQAERRAQ